jgi:hypothetical protein
MPTDFARAERKEARVNFLESKYGVFSKIYIPILGIYSFLLYICGAIERNRKQFIYHLNIFLMSSSFIILSAFTKLIIHTTHDERFRGTTESKTRLLNTLLKVQEEFLDYVAEENDRNWYENSDVNFIGKEIEDAIAYMKKGLEEA